MTNHQAAAPSPLRKLIEDCQRDLAEYLVPDSGISHAQIVKRLLDRLDGPQARMALAGDTGGGGEVNGIHPAAQMNAVELDQFRNFIEAHMCRRAPFWRKQPLRIVTVTEAPANGIGPVWTVRCACGEQTNIADIDSW